MPRTRTPGRLAGAFAALALIAFGGTAAQAQTYDVTVTNLTAGRVISPPIIVAHDAGLSVFPAGEPASEELAMVAEDAVHGPLEAALLGDGADVVVAAGPLPPGHSVTLQITPSAGNDRLSALGMLVTTNDAFFAVSGVPVGAGTLNAPAYDAGSEANNELCGYIPGPPRATDSGNANLAGEGTVQSHPGLTGVGDLDAAALGWSDSPVQITIRKL